MNATSLGHNRTCGSPGAGPLVLGAGLSLVSLVTVVGNLLTVAAFVADRSLGKKPSNFLILSLSCADLLIGLAMPVRVGEAVCSFWPFGEVGCQLQVFFNDIGVVAGMASMTVIALDRYLLISCEYPRYLELQSRRNVRRTVAMVWSTAVSSALVEIILWETVDWAAVDGAHFAFEEECLSPPRNNVIFASTIFVTVFLVPIVGIVGMSLRFLVLLRRRLREFHKQPTDRKGSQALSSTTLPRSDGENQVTSKLLKTSTLSSNPTPKSPPPSSKKQFGEMELKETPSWSSRSYKPEGDPDAAGKHAESERATARDRYVRPAIIMGALVITFLVSCIPYLVFISVIVQVCPECYHDNTQFHFVNVLFLNSCINPFLYAATHPKIRTFHGNLARSIKNKVLCR